MISTEIAIGIEVVLRLAIRSIELMKPMKPMKPDWDQR